MRASGPPTPTMGAAAGRSPNPRAEPAEHTFGGTKTFRVAVYAMVLVEATEPVCSASHRPSTSFLRCGRPVAPPVVVRVLPG